MENVEEQEYTEKRGRRGKRVKVAGDRTEILHEVDHS